MSGPYERFPFMLTVLDTLPAHFLDTPARELHRLLPGPTLIHLPGRRQPELFVSVLLHGNEDSGVVALQSVLRTYAGRPLPRAQQNQKYGCNPGRRDPAHIKARKRK